MKDATLPKVDKFIRKEKPCTCTSTAHTCSSLYAYTVYLFFEEIFYLANIAFGFNNLEIM